ncbi:type II toxin-antitoxin system death-on-curing family toxin [Streptomyces sp. NPDC058394]|uniref:type II toxin-antitoxin system death-on-curing family toxin n=1 Tax=Streptomyces sp. NPDC058394 TaxID=3346477 RepID=UPI003669B5A0
MPPITEFLDSADVLAIAETTLGFRPGVRDYGLLESAVSRPQASVFGEDAYPTIFEKAAALLHSVASNHSLVDGNKRTGWAAALVFLDINSYSLVDPLDEDTAEEFVLAVAQSTMANADIATQLRSFVEEAHG